MVLKNGQAGTNGSASRRCQSWIESFIEYTENIESPVIYRRWAAISLISAALEQKVFIETSSPLFPNLYIFLVGPPATGKTRSIAAVRRFSHELPDLQHGPTSVTMASLVDRLVEAKRIVIDLHAPPMEFNCLYCPIDELSAFLHKYDDELIGGLTHFYDGEPYTQSRRGKDIRIKVKNPLVGCIVGATPSNLTHLIPDWGWEQGFTSRVIMVYSEERPMIDIFGAPRKSELPKDMLHDLKAIYSLIGSFGWTEEYSTAIHNWRNLGQPPVPKHPKLVHYCSRRLAHLLKLSMVASVDLGDSLKLNVDNFNTALGWLLEAELHMPDIFRQVVGAGADSSAIDEIYHFVSNFAATGIAENKLINEVRKRVPAHAVLRVVEIMEKSHLLQVASIDKRTGMRFFKVNSSQSA